MDEPKPRIWDEQRHKMYEVIDLVLDSNGNIVVVYLKDNKGIVEEVRPNEERRDELKIRMYSGIKDKNDDLIYDRDLLKDESGKIFIITQGYFINHNVHTKDCIQYGWYLSDIEGRCFKAVLFKDSLERVCFYHDREQYDLILEGHYIT